MIDDLQLGQLDHLPVSSSWSHSGLSTVGPQWLGDEFPTTILEVFPGKDNNIPR